MFNIDDKPITSPRKTNAGGARPYVLLMTEYMKLSPSYHLARRYRLENWGDETLYAHIIELYQLKPNQASDETIRQSLMSDFDRVLKTYDEYGDLTQISFRDWWLGAGLDIYAHDHEVFHVTRFGRLERDEQDGKNILNNLERYLKQSRVSQNNPPTIFVAIPLGMTKRKALAQLSYIIDHEQVPVIVKAQKPKRPFTAKRLHQDTLRKYLNVLKGRAIDPELPLWKLGLKCNISSKNKDSITADAKPNNKNVDQRLVLAVLTSRALKKAIYIAEHAARGDFPLNTKRQVPEYDWDKIYEFMRKSDPKLPPRESTSSN